MEGTCLEATFPERFKEHDHSTTKVSKQYFTGTVHNTETLSKVYSLLSHTMTDPFAETNMNTINMGFTY